MPSWTHVKRRLLFHLLPGISASGWEDGHCSGKGKTEGGNYSSTSEPIIPLYPKFARNPLLQADCCANPKETTHTHKSLGEDTKQVKPVKTWPALC